MGISIKPRVSLISFLGFVLLFANIPISSVTAEINDLSETERANIQLVIDNINELIGSLEEMRDNGSSRERAIAVQLIAEYTPIRANIESKLVDDIKSVPGLDGDPPRYRHGEHTGTPKGAYCGDDQAQIRNDDGTWEPCPQGTIILDSDLLDPGNGTPIDESTQEGWEDKWELVDIIVHEKYHEKFIDREIQTLQGRAWWNNLTDEQKEQRIQEAIERATTARMHAGVYVAQKNFVSMHKELLDDEKDDLRDEKRDLVREKRTLERGEGNEVRINEINERLAEIEQRQEDIENQMDWLTDRRRTLERAASRAVSGSHFGFEDCSWPLNHTTGNVSIIMTFPAGLERIDLQVLENQVMDVRITDTIWYEEYEQIDPIIWEPSLYMEMTEPVFSSTIFQPNVCNYIDEMLETGEIKASTTPLPIFETYMEPYVSEIPAWIKNNADWWVKRLIGDLDFATGIAYLVKEDIIHVENVEVDPQGEIVIDENITIPTWIHNNAAWWVSGSISDLDFLSGIQYMVTEEIISFQARALVDKDYVDVDLVTIQKLLEAHKWSEVVFTQVLEIKNAEFNILDDATDEAWQQYSDDKNQNSMEYAISLETATSTAKTETEDALKILKTIQTLADLVKDTGVEAGIPVLELEAAVDIQEQKIEEITKLSSINEINDAYKDALKSQQLAVDAMTIAAQNILQDDWDEVVYGGTRSVPIDVNDLIQWVLRESYLQQTKDLQFYAEKVKFFNDTKKQIREEMQRARDEMIKFAGIDEPFELEPLFIQRDVETIFEGKTSTEPPEEEIEEDLPGLDDEVEPEPTDVNITKYVDDIELGAWSSTYSEGVVTVDFWVHFYVRNYDTDRYNDYLTTFKILNNRGEVVYQEEIYEHPIGGTIVDGIPVNPSDGPFTLLVEDAEEGELQKRILPNVPILYRVTVLNIGGEQYPITQFTLWQWKGECDDAWHYHTNSGHAVNTKLLGLADPDSEECGYGKVSEIDSSPTTWQRDKVRAFIDLTGINPVGDEAMMGGSGP